MPRRRSPPRLYLDPKRKQWIIRDGAGFIRTGCAESNAKQAEVELASYLAKKYKPQGGPDPLITDVLLFYSQEHLPSTKAATNNAYFISNLAKWFTVQRLSNVTPSLCREYARTKTPTAARRDLEFLRAAIHFWAKERGPVAAIPSIILPPNPEPRDRWLTRAEAKRLRRAAMRWPWIYRLVILGLLTGTRSGQIFKMKWSWIDLDTRLMRRRAYGEPENSRKRTPPVRINARLARLMRRWKRDGCEWVVHYHGRPVYQIEESWKKACSIAGLEGVTPHTLRHTRATWLMQEGIDPWEAAGHLGMSMNTLTRVYGKHHPTFQQRAAEV